MTISDTRLAQLSERFAGLEARMASGQLEGAEFVSASRDYAELEPVARAASAVQAMRSEISDLTAMLGDPEMRAIAQGELGDLQVQLPAAEHARQHRDGQRMFGGG